MKWENRVIAGALAILVAHVVAEAFGWYSLSLAGFEAWLYRWQTMIATLLAACIAVLGIGYQVARQGAWTRREIEAQDLRNMQRIAHGIYRDLVGIARTCSLHLAIASELEKDDEGHEIRHVVFDTLFEPYGIRFLNIWEAELGIFGPLAVTLHLVLEGYGNVIAAEENMASLSPGSLAEILCRPNMPHVRKDPNVWGEVDAEATYRLAMEARERIDAMFPDQFLARPYPVSHPSAVASREEAIEILERARNYWTDECERRFYRDER